MSLAGLHDGYNLHYYRVLLLRLNMVLKKQQMEHLAAAVTREGADQRQGCCLGPNALLEWSHSMGLHC